jgi:hypothetical protein
MLHLGSSTEHDQLLRSSSKASLRHVILQLRGQRDLSVSDCLALPYSPDRARCSGWSTDLETTARQRPLVCRAIVTRSATRPAG